MSKRTESRDSNALARKVLAGDRRALAQAITLIESTRSDHRRAAEALLEHLLPKAGASTRLGITGVPGVGKSTFIETFGLDAIARGHRVAVLAVDPSSKRSGGSILGDKTRMELLARDPAAFIRPSPTGGTLGGVARRTREAMLACEAAGFDLIVVETVGVGQSEAAVAELVDMFLLLLLPGAGDELQGIKRGIVELADLVIVNKADGDLLAAANHAAAEYRHALALLRAAAAGWRVPVLQVSAVERRGIEDVWAAVGAFRDAMKQAGTWSKRRATQATSWMWSEIEEGLAERFRAHAPVREALGALERRVEAGSITPTAAALELLVLFADGDGGHTKSR